MNYNIFNLFLLFMIYSILGYFIECISVSINTKKLTFSRGFLLGPYLPVFGFGGVIIILFLQKYSNDLIVLFIMSMLSCLLLEYFTSYILEKIFNLRWWDYSDKKYNLNGRISLDVGLMFGILGVILIKIINPFFEKIINKINSNTCIIISSILIIIFLIDFIISIYSLIKVKDKINKYKKDSTEEIRKKIFKELKNKDFLIIRILKSFPSMKKIKK